VAYLSSRGARGRSGLSVPQLLLAFSLVYLILVGGTDVGTFNSGVRALNALLGAAVIAAWALALRQGSDRSELLIALGLLAYLAASVFSQFPRQSFDAGTTALAWTAALGLARRELREPAARTALVGTLAFCGGALILVALVGWLPVWTDWIATAGTLPPLDLSLPAGLYRHYYVVAMMLAALLPALLALRGRRGSALGLVLGALSMGVIILTGARSAWLGLAAGAIFAIVAYRYRPSRTVAGLAVLALLGTALGGFSTGLAGSLWARMTAVSTVDLRFEIWAATLSSWLERPLLGSGPGSFGIAFTETGYFSNFAAVGRHADNAFIQLLAEGGLVGLIGAALIGAGIAIGIRRTSLTVPAGAGLMILIVSAFTNNPTDSANLVAVGVAWAALLSPFGASGSSTRARFTSRRLSVALGIAGMVLLIAVASVNTAAILFERAGDQLQAGHASDATRLTEMASGLDPSLALYHRELGVMRLRSGEASEAVAGLSRALDLNPTDATAWRAMAMAHSGVGDHDRARHAATRAARLRPLDPANGLVRALVAERAGHSEEKRVGLETALLAAPWLPAAPSWTDLYPGGDDLGAILSSVATDVADDGPARARDGFSHAWLSGITGVDMQLPDDGGVRALHAVLSCRFGMARAELRSIPLEHRTTAPAFVAEVLSDASDDGSTAHATLRRLVRLRNPELGAMAATLFPPQSPYRDQNEDIRLYRRLGLPAVREGLMLPTSAEGLSHWLAAPSRSARVSAPGSEAAACFTEAD
jgi:O-antigen ligase/tetratricopeptide (TPR) repeat protein